MSMPISRLLQVCTTAALLAALAAGAAMPGAAETGQYRNIFSEYLGKSEADIDARLQERWRQITEGDKETQRLIYPAKEGTVYIPDLVHQDVRSEGISYGMMLAVQLDQRAEFDALWKFAKTYMYHADGPNRGYFAWHTTYDGKRLSDGPAPDGEEWFVMALFFAHHRWGSREGIYDYHAQAQSLLRSMLHKDREPDRGEVNPMFHREARQIVFVPAGPGATFTDPSYHLPAFYELWARWAADPDDRALLAQLAPISRKHFRDAAHPKTGLMPDYAEFDGRPRVQNGHEHFQYDAWRTLANVALDWSWWRADPWQVEQSNRVLRFLGSHGPDYPNRYELDGTPLSKNSSPGLQAMAAVAALAAERAIGAPFVARHWANPMPEGHGRYYDGLLVLLADLQVSGRFRVYGPVE